MFKYERMIGQRFGAWTIIGIGKKIGNARSFLCRCDCGRKRLVPWGNLTRKPPAPPPSRGCSRCGAKKCIRKVRTNALRRHRKLGRKFVVLANGKPEFLCRECGTVIGYKSTYCRSCASALRPRKAKYGVKLAEVAELSGVTKQAVSHYVKKYGWAAAAKFYGVAA